MREPITPLEDRFLRYEAVIDGRPGMGPGRVDLLRSKDGDQWFLPVSPDEAWVAVPAIPHGGGGWYRSDRGLDPSSRGWEAVDPIDVLLEVRYGEEEVVALTAAMVSTCIADGLGARAVELADALTDRGFKITLSVGR
jgi:hypothetical protein